MKLPTLSTTPSKKVLIGSSVTTVAMAFLAGAIVTLHQPPTRSLDLAGKKTGDTINQDTGTATPGTGPAGTATSAPTSSGSSSTNTTGTGSGTTTSAPATSTTAPAPTGTSAPATTAPAPVTATSAALSDWTAPQATGPNSTVRYQYCTWGYSDGTTKQKVYRTEYTGTNSGTTIMAGFDCTLASAP